MIFVPTDNASRNMFCKIHYINNANLNEHYEHFFHSRLTVKSDGGGRETLNRIKISSEKIIRKSFIKSFLHHLQENIW